MSLETNVDILSYLPPVIRDIREVKSIGVAENPELKLLWQTLDDLMNDQFIHTATEKGIRRWERILEIKPSSSSTLEDRRWEILNRINVKIPYTFNMLRNKLSAMYGDRFTLKFINGTYTLKIRISNELVKQLESTKNMLDVIVPANIAVDLDVY